MKTGIYVIFDSAARDILGGLQLHRHDAVAVRSFTDVATMRDSRIAAHPDDYALMKIGDLADDALTIEPHAPQTIITASTLIQALNAKANQENDQ